MKKFWFYLKLYYVSHNNLISFISDKKLNLLQTIIMAINPLANPKGIKLNCELCNKPAFIYCTKCRVTHYWYVKINFAHIQYSNSIFKFII